MDKKSGMIGRIIGDYKLVRFIKSGGMKDVYEAVHRDEISMRFALYILKSELMPDPSYQRRFEREARALSLVKHENVIRIFDVLKEPDVRVIVTEYIEGEMTLSQLIHKHGRLPLKKAMDVFEQISRALSYVHSLKILHRDIKPSNIMLTSDGIVKVIDFGIAVGSRGDGSQAAGIGVSGSETSKGVFIGTLDFASPEQLMAQRDLDERTDIYSLGVLFFYMLTGVLPFAEDRKRDKPPSAREFHPILSLELGQVIVKALNMKQDERYQSIEEFVQAVAGCPESGWSEFEKKYQRAEELCRQGVPAEALREWEGAQELLKKMLVRTPASSEAEKQLKIVESRIGELKKSQEANVLYRKALEFSRAGAPEEAARQLEKVISLDPQRLDARRLLSYLRKSLVKEADSLLLKCEESYQNGKLEEAEALARAIIEKHPESPEITSATAIFNECSKQKESIKRFNVARGRATELFRKCGYEECLTSVNEALAIKPDDREMVQLKEQCETRMAVARVEEDITRLLKRGRPREARQHLTTLYARAPTAAETWLVKINAVEEARKRKRAALIRWRKLSLRGAIGSVAVGILVVGYLHIIAGAELKEIRELYEQAKSHYILAKKYIPGYQSPVIKAAGAMIVLGESLTREQRQSLAQDLSHALDRANREGKARVKEIGETFHNDMKAILAPGPIELKPCEEKRSALTVAKDLVQADYKYRELQKRWRSVLGGLREDWKDTLQRDRARIEKRHPTGVTKYHSQWDRIHQDINSFIKAKMGEEEDLLPVARKQVKAFRGLRDELGRIESKDAKILAEIKARAAEYDNKVRIDVENINTDRDLLAGVGEDIVALNDKGFLDRYEQISEKSSQLRERIISLSHGLSKIAQGEVENLYKSHNWLTGMENEISILSRQTLGLREQVLELKKLAEVREEASAAYRIGYNSYQKMKENYDGVMKKAAGANFDEQRELGLARQKLELSWNELKNRYDSQKWESDWSDLRNRVGESAKKMSRAVDKLSERLRKEARLILSRMDQDIEPYKPLVGLLNNGSGIKETFNQLKELRNKVEEALEYEDYQEIWKGQGRFSQKLDKIAKKAAAMANQRYLDVRTIYQDTEKLMRVASRVMPGWKAPFSELQKLQESVADLENALNNKKYAQVVVDSRSLANGLRELTLRIEREVLNPKRNKLQESLQKAAQAYETAKERLRWKFDFFNPHRHYGETFAEWVEHPRNHKAKERERILVANWRKVRAISDDDLKDLRVAYEMIDELDKINRWIDMCRLVWESAEEALKAGVTIRSMKGREIFFNKQSLGRGKRKFDAVRRQWFYEITRAVDVQGEEETYKIEVAGRGKVVEVTLRPGEHKVIRIYDRVEIPVVAF